MKPYTLFALSILPSMSVIAAPKATMSFQGYSGLINTPTATLFEEGRFYFQYSNQVEIGDGYYDGQNYNFAVGLWKYVEVSGRLAEYKFTDHKGGPTDLSANVKLGIPYIPEDWFKLAIGVQDLGGAANYFDSKYAVLSKTLFEDFSFSVGYGISDLSSGRLNGVFAGAEWQPYEWVKASVEYDAADTQVGLHLSTPKDWLYNDIQLNTDVLVSSTNDDLSDDFYYSVGLSVPLHLRYDESKSQVAYADTKNTLYHDEAKQAENTPALTPKAEQEKIKQLLIKEGFEDIVINERNNTTIYVSVQNHSYNRDQVDGLGVVLALLSKNIHYNYTDFEVVLTEQSIPIMAVNGNLIDYLGFLRDNKPLKVSVLTDNINSKPNQATVDSTNNFWFKPRFTFWPGVASRIGTELGVFDASFALISHVELPLWKGSAITAQHVNQVAETKNFEDGNFFASGKQETGVSEFSFHQTFALPFSIKNMTSLGRYRYDYNYLANEIKWQSPEGAHSVNLLTARYENQKEEKLQPYPNCNILFSACWPSPEPKDRNVIVAKYQYYNSALNSSAEIQFGEYWQRDKGVKINLNRMMGDVTLTLSYKNTKVSGEKADQLIGLGFTMPLTPRKDFNNRYVQVRGKPNWDYSLSTIIGEESNDLTPGTADSARSFYNIDNVYYNYNRLSKDYIYRNTERLKAASF
ncbi:YjbH domain-containing protein [Colwellia sp. E2M01]|uniref:YjbH domain-containing protein n=1 Tax=Colwellia sp. E2M01 TaxID=2841561 RepID=UPI001C0A1C6E|nr:YjbH domain-containing protein [Colwellia sp. E2M01]MBU2869194.1 YjbH domain-containing protein [Colwellia sp. E2M01]